MLTKQNPHVPTCAPQESLRKYSVVPVVVRQLSADDELEGHPIPAGTTVICHLQVRFATNQRKRHPACHTRLLSPLRLWLQSAGGYARQLSAVTQARMLL